MARLYGPTPGDPPALIRSTDLAGLSTTDVEDRPVGKTFGALADEESGLIRYLDIALDSVPRHVLVPIGHSRFDRDHVPPRLRLRAAAYEDLLRIPEFTPDETDLTQSYQDALLNAHGALFYGSRYYAHPAYDHRGMYEGEEALEPAGDGAEPGEASDAETPGLRPLGELKGYRVARGQKDPRGWPLVDDDGDRVGDVADLLVDVGARRVRYVVVTLDELDRPVAIPVGYLEMRAQSSQVVAPELDVSDIRVLPPYEPPLDREAENRIQAALAGRLTGSRIYDRPDFMG